MALSPCYVFQNIQVLFKEHFFTCPGQAIERRSIEVQSLLFLCRSQFYVLYVQYVAKKMSR
jgi:hypothetical protein